MSRAVSRITNPVSTPPRPMLEPEVKRVMLASLASDAAGRWARRAPQPGRSKPPDDRPPALP